MDSPRGQSGATNASANGSGGAPAVGSRGHLLCTVPACQEERASSGQEHCRCYEGYGQPCYTERRDNVSLCVVSTATMIKCDEGGAGWGQAGAQESTSTSGS